MADRLKEIPAKILEWWNRFTTKQKSAIVGIVAAVIFTFVILIYIFTRTQYVLLDVYEDAKTASQVVSVLDENGIAHRESGNGLRVEVEAGQESAANIALGAAGFSGSALSYSDFVSSSMSTTSTDRENQYKIYMEAYATKTIESMNAVKKATVLLYIPRETGTLIREREEATAWIQLELQDTFTSANAANLARAVATWLGNSNTSNITIVDSDANALFYGGDDYGVAGVANSLQELQNQAGSMVDNQVKKVLMGTNQYDSIEVTSHLNMDYSSYEETLHDYSVDEGRTEGYLASQDLYESENTSGAGGTPGTDSNNETTYYSPDGSSTSSSSAESHRTYLPDEDIKKIITSAGVIDYSSSSITVAMIRFRVLHEEEAKDQGLLDGITWAEYKRQNASDTKLEVDSDFYSMVATATGMPQENITIVAYETPVYYDKEPLDVNWTTVLSVVMLIIILALLAFVVLRSMSSQKEVPEEEELSVESLLQSNPESPLEDIDVETKSETRKMIEKFVDENPEAAAALLRNWLNDDWG